jgi:hypothetical protein
VLLLGFSRESTGEWMRRFIEEADRGQWTLLPECLDDFIDESNPVRVTPEALHLRLSEPGTVEPACRQLPCLGSTRVNQAMAAP